MARHLGLSDEAVQTVWWAAALHDLGKLAVPIEVLRKVGPLDESEWKEMRRHPAVGADLVLSASASLAPIAEAIRAHHERWDGSGYPDGLIGEDIPLLGRIIAIVDAFDAMTHVRSYRSRIRSGAEGVAELQYQSGSQFDAHLVSVFVELHDDGQLVSR